MFYLGMSLFLVFLLALLALDIFMLISLIRSGDERNQMIVWKSSSYTLIGVIGYMMIKIIESLLKAEAMTINPFTQLGATAIIYCILLLFYKRKYGG